MFSEDLEGNKIKHTTFLSIYILTAVAVNIIIHIQRGLHSRHYDVLYRSPVKCCNCRTWEYLLLNQMNDLTYPASCVNPSYGWRPCGFMPNDYSLSL